MKYSAFVFQQRGNQSPKMAMFYAPAKEILAWAAIDRLSPTDKGGIQRIENRSRTKHIAEFFKKQPQNTIPTAVIVALEGVRIEHNENSQSITFEVSPGATLPGLVIDGQHRLLGMRLLDEEVLVPVVALLNVDDAEKAFQFIVINNKGQKVPTDHIRALRLEYKEDLLNERLKAARLSVKETYTSVGVANDSPESPFRGMIDWAKTPDHQRRVSPSAIEDSIHALTKSSDRLLSEPDASEDFFFALWRLTKEVWPRAWDRENPYNAHWESHLLHKSSIVTVTQLAADYLTKWASFPGSNIQLDDPSTYSTSLRDLLLQIDEKFWLVPWKLSSLDTSAGRRTLFESIRDVIENFKARVAWHEGVTLVDSAALRELEEL